jgi:hypothetical protein
MTEEGNKRRLKKMSRKKYTLKSKEESGKFRKTQNEKLNEM